MTIDTETNTETAVAVREQTAIESVREQLELRAQDIEKLGMDPQRFIRVSMTALAKNPDLLACSRTSIILSIIEAAQVGLEPTGGIGGAHLVPFRDKSGQKHAQLIYDYRGVQHLIRKGGGGEVKTVLAYEGDIFKVYEGTERPRIHHSPKYATQDPAKIIYVYAIPLDHPEKFEVMSKAQIDGIRARAKSPNAGPWVSDFGAMARKTVLKRISAWLPLVPEIRQALDQDTEREIPEEPTGPTVSRTSSVLDEVRTRRRGKAKSPSEAPGAADDPKTPDAAPVESADQQTQPAEQPATVEGQVRELCGAAGTAVAEGEVCALDKDHEARVHKNAAGTASWPV